MEQIDGKMSRSVMYNRLEVVELYCRRHRIEDQMMIVGLTGVSVAGV